MLINILGVGALFIAFVFVLPITSAHIAGYLERKLFVHLPKWIVVTSTMLLVLGLEVLVTLMISRRLEWSFVDAHFTVGFLIFILVWFMQFNEFIGNRYANLENKGYGSGKDLYDIELFRFKVNPISIAALLYFLVSIANAFLLYL